MKFITLLTLITILFVGCVPAQNKGCKDFTLDGWHIVYNKYYNKYAAMATDSLLGKCFLLKNQWGKYGIYGEDWAENVPCIGCADVSKSLFNTPCEVKEFILAHAKKLEEDKWQSTK